MSFATLARVVSSVPSSFATPQAVASAQDALDLHAAILSNQAGWPRQLSRKRRTRRANEHVLTRMSRNALLANYVQSRTERGHV
ncbi:MAG TPA: hypothetical protein VJN18_10335 [Polyangiaceae bacterium]|nr:hypothetical protein [Polyangiaceae bacterium]